MNVSAYLHLSRCLEPCGGVGRHANNMLKQLARHPGVNVSLLCSREHITASGELPKNFPLNSLSANYVPVPELLLERSMRLSRLPKLNWFAPQADWYYCPMETPIPVSSGRSAMTLHDVAWFEPDLPWSNLSSELRAKRNAMRWIPDSIKRADKVLTVSQFSKSRMVDILGAEPEKVHVVGNGVEQAFFNAGVLALERPGSQRRAEVIVLGGLRYKKGADHVFEVAEVLRKERSDLTLIAVGQNDVQYAKMAKDHPNIKLVGMLADDELIKRISESRALLLLSLYEGFGIPPLEAMACGTPAVVSDCGSLPEIVGDAGFVFRVNEHRAVASLLHQLGSDDLLYREAVRKGQAHAKNYTWENCFQKLRQALKI